MKHIPGIKRYHIAALLFLFTLFSLFFAGRNSLPTVAERQILIVIDAGHGAPDGGAVGKSGAFESDINLAVSKLLCAELESRGYAVLMTRSDENGIFRTEKGSIKEKKREDMKERLRIANGSGADLFLSIHMNFFTDSKYSGPQVFYKEGSEAGARVAETVRQSFLQNIGSHCTREVKSVKDGIYLLREVKIPAVLIECGFLSNAEEESLLKTPEYQSKMSKAIAEGVDAYFNN